MNKQGKGKIDWASVSWNVITGCEHNCHYCYAKRMAKRLAGRYGYPKENPFQPIFHSDRLHQPINFKKPQLIFVSSMGDLWGEWVPSVWIHDVLNVCAVYAPWHLYQFLTKNPKRYKEFKPLDNCWYGTTDDGTKRTKNNIKALVKAVSAPRRFVSFEPLLAEIEPDLTGIQWVIIGADSTRGAVKPPKEWADKIINLAWKKNIPVFMKDNYNYPIRIKQVPIDIMIVSS
jgi:protein gp37